MTLNSRMVWRFLIAVVLAAVVYAISETLEVRLWEPAFVTGWVLFAGMLLLTLLNVRKKLPFLPVLPVRFWLQFHIYIGWLTVGVFLIHIDFSTPNGALELTLAVLFLVVALSGIFGIFISGSFAKRLTRRGEELIYERIPMFRHQLREAADDLAAFSVEKTGSTTIAEFYMDTLQVWFRGPRDYIEHLFELNGRIFQLERAFDDVGRYLNDDEKEQLGELRALVRKKYDLDYSDALQRTLKYWLFVHIPATYALLVFAVVHVVLVHAFTGAVL